MKHELKVRAESFVLFPLGNKRFALRADEVAELARPDRLQTFPHTTTMLAGVLLRRGRIVPVCDVAGMLNPQSPTRKYFLIAKRRAGNVLEWLALPVTGECELLTAEMIPPTGRLPEWVCGLLALDADVVEVLDLEKMMGAAAARQGAREVTA